MATITASAAGGAWNTTAAWVGGVIPLSGDDVLLTAASGPISLPAATTVACRSLDCTGYVSTLTWAATNSVLNVGDASGGNVKFVAGMTLTRTGIGNLTLVGSTASTIYTLTTAGLVMPNIVVSAGASTTYQFADNVTATGAQIFITSGTLDTTGKTISAGLFASSGTTARTLTLGASAITLSQAVTFWSFATATNLTVTANTATVTATTVSGPTFAGGGANYNGMSLTMNGAAFSSSPAVISGANTLGNLTVNGNAIIDSTVQLSANQTVTGTLTLTGNAAANRLWVTSDIVGTARTITCNTTVTVTRADFEDITGAGTASWNISGATEGSGDCGGNSGITFTTAVSKYGKAAGNWSATATWALSSGGAAGAPIPLPQDTVVLDATSGAGTWTMNMMRHCKDLVCTGFTGTLSLASSAIQRYMFGSLTLGSGMTFTATGSFTLAGRGSHTINMAGKAFTAATSRMVTVGRFGGTYTLTADADFGSLATATASGFRVLGGATFAGGTFDAAGFNVSATRVVVGTANGSLKLGSGTWNLTGTGDAVIWDNSQGSTVTAGTSNIVIANASATLRTFQGSGSAQTYYDLTYTVAGSTGGLDVTLGPFTFHNLNFSDATNARTLRFTAAKTHTFTGTFNVFGTAGKLMTVTSLTAAAHTLSKASGTVSSDYLSISQSQAGGGAAWYAGANSTDGGSNTGWIFTAPPAAGGTSSFFVMF